MGQALGSAASPVSYRSARDVVFLGLRDTVFCTECELISYNHSSRCLACGSSAVLSLARVLGGSLHGQETARLVRPEVIDAVVGQVLRGVAHAGDEPRPPSSSELLAQSTCRDWTGAEPITKRPQVSPVAALEIGARRCRELTGANGAAVAISNGERVICRAHSGNAPEVGVEVSQEGITALCLRTGQLWRCDDTEREPWANRTACRALGIRSMVIAPMVIPKRVIGVLEVFSSVPSAFDDYHSATVQFFAGALTVAILRRAAENREQQRKALAADDESGSSKGTF